MSKSKKVLIAGWGGMARKHMQALESLGVECSFISLKEAVIKESHLNHLSIDFALITSPSALHIDQAILLAKHNIPFLVEKPVSSHTKNLKQLIQVLRKKRLLNYVACQLRFDPLLIKAKALIYQNKPHRIHIYCHSHLPSWRPGRDYRKTYSADKKLGGGVAYDLIHEFDYLFWWLGKPQKILGFCEKKSSLSLKSPDVCSAVAHYPKTLAEISLGYCDQNQKRGFELFYENKILRGDLLTGELTEEKKGNSRLIKTFPRSPSELLEKQMRYFLTCLSSRKKSFNTVEDGAQVLQMVHQLEGA